MEPTNRKPSVQSPPINRRLKTEAFRKGISMILSHWIGLQMAVDNQWGGRDSFKKSEELASDIHSLFSSSKVFTFLDFQLEERVNVEDLESMLHERLLLSFNTEIEDGSIEEVAEQLMVLHEEYMQGNH